MPEKVDSTVAAIEAAAFSPELIPAMMQRVATLCGGELAIAFSADPGKPDLLGDDRATEMQRDYLAGGWQEIDIVTQAIRRLPRGGLRLSQEFLGSREIEEHPFFQEYLVRHGGPWGAGWHVSTSGGSDVISISAFRPFQRDQVELLHRLAPLIDASLLTASSIHDARVQGAAEGMAFAGRASMLLDARGCVTYVSEKAERLFNPEFGVADKRLRASDPASMRELARITACAQNRFAASPCHAVVRRTEQSPVAIVGTRLAGAGLDLFGGGRMLLMLVELKPTARPSDTILRQVYGLTPRESRIASMFANGASSEEISTALSLRTSTVRQHIKAVLTKTETHRQAELALLLAAIPDDALDDEGQGQPARE
jgi:DNA-binding CsgD family transcriptional regulator